ncbi:MAG: hypothetical protein HGA75_07295 [Thiobacillus sp.]|nr:hypothetical protein [Thiobacillus sp.]
MKWEIDMPVTGTALKTLLIGLFVVLASARFGVAPAALTLSDYPLFLTVNVTPNVVITLDDSLSMSHAHVPDTIGHNSSGTNIASGRRYKSSYYNALYYNPSVVYDIPTRSDGTTYSTSFTAAYVNGFDSGKGSINLSNNYTVTFQYYPDVSATDYTSTSNCSFLSATATGTPIGGWGNTCLRARNPSQEFTTNSQQTSGTAAYYYLFWSQKPGQTQPGSCTGNAAQQKEDEDCYVKVNVGSSADIASGNSTAQKQNFANWFSFYRNRALSAMSGAMNAVTSLETNQIRLAWQTVNKTGCTSFGTTCQGYDNTSHENRMRSLDAFKTGSATVTHRKDFYDWLQRFDLSGSTPLRTTLKRAGDYYKASGLSSPYAEEPYVTLGTELSCRKNFHILFTDGLWNSDNNTNFGGNVDSTSRTLPDGTAYSPQYPYRNTGASPPSGMSYSNSLADIAFDYWATDLRTGAAMPNNLTPHIADRSGTSAQQYWNPRNDPATWQHMVNFTIGFGLGATLTDPAWGGSTYTGDYAALAAGTKYWPAIDESPTLGNEPIGHVYDLWHAAINSRGEFFSVDNPQALNSAFQTALTSILNANPSAAALAANSTSLQTGTLVYQARFDSQDWHGQFIAFPVSGDGSISTAQWDAADLIPAAASRAIFTYDGSSGKTFSNCNSSLSAAQKTALDTNASGVVDNKCSERMAWLRGDTSKEVRFAGGIFRNRRVTVLGDIINSDPIYVKDEDYGYAGSTVTMAEKSSYQSFLATKASRTPVVYVGANDGMLHGFRADVGNVGSGQELFAYIPAGVYGNLSKLTDPAYAHKAFVDGAPSVGDAYLSGQWKTILVGGLGAGGKSIYALDISDPENMVAGKVLWEYTDAVDLGNTFSQPQIGRLHNGDWAAIFGNGYNGASDKAFLYVVRLRDGALLAKIAAGTSTANGLSTPVLYDGDGDKIIDAAYAGDLQGNLWKFDLSGASAASWGVANGGAPLFSARNDSNQIQPITTQPKIGSHPSGGVLVNFGTGRYLTSADPGNMEVQSFYAIWDNGTLGTVVRSQLQEQRILSETTEFGFDVRETSLNTVDYAGGKRGWYLDLILSGGSATGERVVSPALIKYGRVIFSTMIPSTETCSPGGTSWVMELDMLTGSGQTGAVFDLNNDDKFDADDELASGRYASGVKSTVGITKTPVWLDNPSGEMAFKELSGTSGNIMTLKNKGQAPVGSAPVRVYWQQII